MPSPTQVRYHYGRVQRLHWKLQDALNDAHNADVIAYEGEWKDEAPCWAMSELWRRITRTTEKALAKAMRDEIRKGNK